MGEITVIGAGLMTGVTTTGLLAGAAFLAAGFLASPF